MVAPLSIVLSRRLFCPSVSSRSASLSGRAISVFLGQPPESRCSSSTLSAMRIASAVPYHGGSWRRQAFQETIGAAVQMLNTRADG